MDVSDDEKLEDIDAKNGEKASKVFSPGKRQRGKPVLSIF